MQIFHNMKFEVIITNPVKMCSDSQSRSKIPANPGYYNLDLCSYGQAFVLV